MLNKVKKQNNTNKPKKNKLNKKANETEQLKNYIRTLEYEISNLKSEIKTVERQQRREINAYLEPIRNIFTNIDFKTKNKGLSYIETQLNNLLIEKNYKLLKPQIGTMHDKNLMIVDSCIECKDSSKDGLIEMVLAYGIIKDNDIIIPARVRIYKGE